MNYWTKHQPHETKLLPLSGQHLCQSEIIYSNTTRYRRITGTDGKTISNNEIQSVENIPAKHKPYAPPKNRKAPHIAVRGF